MWRKYGENVEISIESIIPDQNHRESIAWLWLQMVHGNAHLKRAALLLELKNSDNFRRRRRRNLSNLPPATTGYRRDPGRRRTSPVSLAFTSATGIHRLHRHSPAPPHPQTTSSRQATSNMSWEPALFSLWAMVVVVLA